MTKLVFEKMRIPGGKMGPANDYPLLFKPGAFEKGGMLDETEGLFLNYGKVMHTLPYAGLEDYDHSEEIREFDSFVLENDFIKATFVPQLGGRLWSIYDKKDKRDLVVSNPVFRPCNLAICNAWFSGGVEWNCGVRGHHPLTCDRIYAASYTGKDGSPVLRMYAFERMRAITYQMDFFLPENSKNLFARMRLVNGSDKVVPIYWWSTIAVEQKDGARVVVPASETYVNHGLDPVYKAAIPMFDGVDLSYPMNHTEATDHFYKMPDDKRKYEAYLDKDGVGMIHASTRRLKGRKMFVWGTSQGGRNWQRFLTNEDGLKQPYFEIQAGLAFTQNESLPFPPHTAWEWLEAYCPLDMKAEDVHGSYEDAQKNIMSWLDDTLPESEMDKMLEETKSDALKSVEYTFKGHAWGTLDNELRAAMGEKPVSPHLCFGELDEEQMVWHRFLTNGYLDEPDPTAVPASYMVQDEWFAMLKKTVRNADKHNWYAWYNLGICYYSRDEYDLAKEMFEKSLALKVSTWAYHGMACTCFSLGESENGAKYMAKALSMNSGNLQLAKEALRLSSQFGQFDIMLTMLDMLPESSLADPLIMGYKAVAYAHTGRLEEAEAILSANGGLQMDDVREGDDVFPLTYIYIQQQLALRRGETLDAEDVKIPSLIDFRMFHTDRE